MGVRNERGQVLRRMEAKTLDARFLSVIRDGLNCSAFEAGAVLQVVQEVYFPFLDEAAGAAPPGRVTVVAVDAEEPAGKPIAQCQTKTVCLTLHRGADDDRLLQEEGPTAFRRARIPDLCQQALSQGALLTREDLALRVFFLNPRTISRDLAWLREHHPDDPLPIRSRRHDIGPVLTHRVEIVRLALDGCTTTQICDRLHHSPAAVANYLSTFARCAFLARKDMQVSQIAFLLRCGRGLVRQYLDLLDTCTTDRNRAYHLDELLRPGASKKGALTPRRGRP